MRHEDVGWHEATASLQDLSFILAVLARIAPGTTWSVIWADTDDAMERADRCARRLYSRVRKAPHLEAPCQQLQSPHLVSYVLGRLALSLTSSSRTARTATTATPCLSTTMMTTLTSYAMKAVYLIFLSSVKLQLALSPHLRSAPVRRRHLHLRSLAAASKGKQKGKQKQQQLDELDNVQHDPSQSFELAHLSHFPASDFSDSDWISSDYSDGDLDSGQKKELDDTLLQSEIVSY